MGLKIIITGASGFVGEGVLLECLSNPKVSEVLMINRKPLNILHSKLKEYIVVDFMNLDGIAAQLSGYDACFYCAGISSVGMDENAYTAITYHTTLHFAKTLLQTNHNMVFNFVSGSHADSSEKGKIMWARVKGKTENALLKLPFKRVYNFRPGGMIPTEGQHNVKPFYKFIISVIGFISPKRVSTLREVALSLIHAALYGYEQHTLEIAAIKELAGRHKNEV